MHVFLRESSERFGDCREPFDKFAIIKRQAIKGPYVFDALGSWPITNGLDLLWLGFNPMFRDQVTQKVNTSLEECTLRGFDLGANVSQSIQDCPQTFQQLFLSPGEDDNFIKIAQANLPQKIA